jgi:hypothetical protein
MEESSQKPEDRSQESEFRIQNSESAGGDDLRAAIRDVMGEFVEKSERVASLEKRIDELVAENRETQKSAAVRAELQKLGVAKIDLAYKAVREDVRAIEDAVAMREYLQNFVTENPELLPARLAGGSGASAGSRSAAGAETIDLAMIRPGMSAEEMDRVRKEVARVAAQTLKGWNG